MPTWLYSLAPLTFATLIIVAVVSVSLVGLFVVRRYGFPHLQFHDGVNDAISGTVQAIGVFYGVTVGLIAVSVWDNYSDALDTTANEAASIAALYRDVSLFAEPARSILQKDLYDYTVNIVKDVWPAQRRGQMMQNNSTVINRLQATLSNIEPRTQGEALRYAQTLAEYNKLIEHRRLRLDSVTSGLSSVMWWVIWVGAAISVSVAYFFHIEDWKLHSVLIVMMSAFLGLVLFMIAVNDKPFVGNLAIGPDSYQLILNALIHKPH